MPGDPVDQLRIRHAGLARRKREVLVLRQNGIWVRLDEINLVGRRQPKVDARVVVDREQAVDAFTRLLDVGEDRRDADGHEPLIADVTWRMKDKPVRRKLVVELPDERVECRAVEPQAELGDAPFEQFPGR